MSAIGALLALFVVFYIEGYTLTVASAADPPGRQRADDGAAASEPGIVTRAPGGTPDDVDQEGIVDILNRPRTGLPTAEMGNTQLAAADPCPRCAEAPLLGLGERPAGGTSVVHCPECGLREPVATDEPTESGFLPEMDLPGFGAVYRDYCGKPFENFCAGCASTHETAFDCNTSTCPSCANAWARDLATEKAAKLKALWAYKYSKHVKHGDADKMRYHHLVLSPPDTWALKADDPYKTTLEVVKDVMAEMGLEGQYFYHPYRGDEGDDRGAWKGRMFQDRKWDDVRAELGHGPHFHLIVVAEHVPGGELTTRINDETGWVFKRIVKPNSNVSIYGDEDMCASVAYCLSHTGLYEQGGTQVASRPFGPHASGSPTQEAVTPPPRMQREIDTDMRSVAPRVLGVSYADVACDTDLDADDTPDEHRVDPAKAAIFGAGDTPDDRDLDATPPAHHADREFDFEEWASHVPASSPASSADRDADDDDEPEACRGRLLPIYEAPEYLRDPDWCEEAEHVDELRASWREWRDKLEEFGFNPPDDVLDDHPPPD